MRTLLLRTLFLSLLAAPLALTGCETDTEIDQEPDGGVEVERDTTVGVDGNDAEAALDTVGAALERAGEAIEETARDAADAIDDAVDGDTLNEH